MPRPKAGQNVTQLHYARRGTVTPEMEFIAIRENQSREIARELTSRNGHGGGTAQHPGQAWGANIPKSITPEFVRDYIMLHELAHRRHMNHSEQFWQEVARLCPEYAVAERWLKTHRLRLR